MKLRDAAIRAVRSSLQAFVGGLTLSVIPLLKDAGDLKGASLGFAVALALGFTTGLVAFIQNLLEDNTKLPALK